MYTRFAIAALSIALATACTVTAEKETGAPGTETDPTDPSDPTDPTDTTSGTDPMADDDADGLTNEEEAALGTDPSNPDSDGDGFLDGEEADAGTNPTNEYSHTYEGGYNVGYCEGGLPENAGPSLTNAYGFDYYAVGDYAANFTYEDQHGEMVDLYSFCGQTVVMSFGAMWCGPCQDAASQMQAEMDEYAGEGLQLIELLIEDYNYGGGEIAMDDQAYWADTFGFENIPVLGPDAGDYDSVWYNYEVDFYIPSFVVIGPDMQVLLVDGWYDGPQSWL